MLETTSSKGIRRPIVAGGTRNNTVYLCSPALIRPRYQGKMGLSSNGYDPTCKQLKLLEIETRLLYDASDFSTAPFQISNLDSRYTSCLNFLGEFWIIRLLKNGFEALNHRWEHNYT